jgi:hypothetical protein
VRKALLLQGQLDRLDKGLQVSSRQAGDGSR